MSSYLKPCGHILKCTLPLEREVMLLKKAEGMPLSFAIATLWLISSQVTEC